MAAHARLVSRMRSVFRRSKRCWRRWRRGTLLSMTVSVQHLLTLGDEQAPDGARVIGHRRQSSYGLGDGYSPRTACRTRMDGLRTTCSRELGSPAGKGSLMAATAIVPESLMGVDGRPDGGGKAAESSDDETVMRQVACSRSRPPSGRSVSHRRDYYRKTLGGHIWSSAFCHRRQTSFHPCSSASLSHQLHPRPNIKCPLSHPGQNPGRQKQQQRHPSHQPPPRQHSPLGLTRSLRPLRPSPRVSLTALPASALTDPSSRHLVRIRPHGSRWLTLLPTCHSLFILFLVADTGSLLYRRLRSVISLRLALRSNIILRHDALRYGRVQLVL